MPEPRVTKAQVSAAYQRLATALDAQTVEAYREAQGFTPAIDDARRDGMWTLDHSPVYGGYEIRALCASTTRPGERPTFTGERHLFSRGRRSAREFVEWVNGALDVMRVADELALAGELVEASS